MNVVGQVTIGELRKLKPNWWNANVLPAAQRASLRHGLRHEGWLASQALLVWGTDECGRELNVIIDGEHRWQEALDLGFVEAPMVVLDGLTEQKAERLTHTLTALRGKFADAPLAVIVRELQPYYGAELAISLGFDTERLMRLLAVPPALENPPPAKGKGSRPPPVTSQNTSSRTVPLFFDEASHADFVVLVSRIQEQRGGGTVTEAVAFAVSEALERRKCASTN